MSMIKVAMADYKIATRPDSLTTLGLGSCVGIGLYDKLTGIIGLAHIMLPTSSNAMDSSNIAKFADTGIPSMLEEMLKKGAAKFHIVAKIAGGAKMFSFGGENDFMKIGARNIIATEEILLRLKIPILAQDTGGNCGRTIELHSENGSFLIRTVGKGTQIL
jgi:chemotaxis protein CheD